MEMKQRYSIRGVHPRGFTIVEMLGTCLLLSILFSMTIPMLLLVARERQATDQRQFALQHVANLLENAMNRDWSELPAGMLTIPEADSDLLTLLPGLERSLVVQPFEKETDPRQITASVRWKNRAGELVAPIQISTWVHRTGEAP